MVRAVYRWAGYSLRRALGVMPGCQIPAVLATIKSGSTRTAGGHMRSVAIASALLLTALPLPVAAVSDAQLPASTPAVTVPYFQHMLIVLPTDVYDAIKAADLFKARFAKGEESTEVRNEGTYTYTNFYMPCRTTYFEFGRQSDADVEALPAVLEIGMFLDDYRDMPGMLAKARAAGGNWTIVPVRMTDDKGVNRPIYDILAHSDRQYDEAGIAAGDSAEALIPSHFGPEDPSQRLDVFLLAMHGRKPPPVTREMFNSGDYRPDQLCGDISAVEMTATRSEIDRAAHILGTLGLPRIDQGRDSVAFEGTGIRFVFRPAPIEAPRKLDIVLALNTALAEPETYSFGTASVLRLGTDRTAVWSFTLPRR